VRLPEAFVKPEEVHSAGKVCRSHECQSSAIAPQCFTPGFDHSGVPYANGAPNLSVDIPALQTLAHDHNVPICGKDFKTGQTLMKTILAPGFKARMLGLMGGFTNILGIATVKCLKIRVRSRPGESS